MSNFEQKFYAPWFNEINEATKFHHNNQCLPSPGVPANIDKFVFHQRKYDGCADAQCGKFAMVDEVFGKDVKEVVGAECGKKVPPYSCLTSTHTQVTPSSIYSSLSLASSTLATEILVTRSKAMLKEKFHQKQKHPTLKNADLDRAVDNSTENGREAADQDEVTGQMKGAGRQARVVVGRGRSKNSRGDL